jgi:serine/threonine protein kinase
MPLSWRSARAQNRVTIVPRPRVRADPAIVGAATRWYAESVSMSLSSSSSSFSGAESRVAGAELAVGQVVRGRYEVLGLLGRGGMGSVYQARVRRGRHAGQRVAMKVMHAHLGRMREAEARFRREARALRELESPHVARLLDVGRLESGSLFLVMEQVEGKNLVEELAARGPLSWAEAYGIIDQVCAALEVVHAAGVVHRDLKPRNVIVAASGLTKVVDFGLAKSLHGKRLGKSPISREGQAIGSLFYMAPEQAVGRRDVDARADVFSIGCLLYYLLMGQPPFGQREIARAGREGGTLTFPSIGFSRKDVPAHVDEVLRVALAPAAAHRFRSVAALRTALVNDGREVPTLVPPPPEPSRRRGGLEAPARQALWALCGGLLAMGLVLGLWALFR